MPTLDFKTQLMTAFFNTTSMAIAGECKEMTEFWPTLWQFFLCVIIQCISSQYVIGRIHTEKKVVLHYS